MSKPNYGGSAARSFKNPSIKPHRSLNMKTPFVRTPSTNSKIAYSGVIWRHRNEGGWRAVQVNAPFLEGIGETRKSAAFDLAREIRLHDLAARIRAKLVAK